jgi:DNA-binding NarL/FixJ family response regulator
MNESSTAAKKKILIVEDHPMFRAMLAQLIGQEPGMEGCGEVDNIGDAMILIQQSQPDMAIIDITLQGSSGLELIKNLKARHIHLPVIVLSMHAEALYAERVLRAGARGYISKLESPAEVLAAIRKVIDGGIHVSRLVTEAIIGRLGHADEARRPSGLDLLSDREIEVFQLVGRGMNSREIAAQTRLGTSTVDSYRARIKEKLGVRNAAALYQYAAQWLVESGI